ncbi:zinc ribbon domain-containing protein [Sporobacter termitidis]|uniref:zinc ribbon domain-containing protein n=1 Tax=Sporobacter termitidis TaxID=44749 RepID=UPI00135628F0|nr:zinc ribbon domain-containing protein [Sporobacter termitidis]
MVLEDKTAAEEREESLRKEISRLRQDINSRPFGETNGKDLDRERIDPICRQCGHQNEAGTKYCTKCGAMLARIQKSEEAVCPKCRDEINDGDGFCGSCGWDLTKKEPGPVLVSTVNGQVVCPECGTAQMSNRLICYKCGTKFEYR